jgi:hypothetical protein
MEDWGKIMQVCGEAGTRILRAKWPHGNQDIINN